MPRTRAKDTLTSRIDVRSSSLDPSGGIPPKHAKNGENISPALEWSGVPARARSLVITVDDPDAPGPSPFTHWLLYGLPAAETRLREGIPRSDGRGLPAGAAQGRNSFRTEGYAGPAPPAGQTHHYRFIVTALDASLDLKPGADRGEVEKAMAGHVLARGELVGTYGR